MKSTVTSSLLSGSVGPGLNKLSVDFDDLSANFFLSDLSLVSRSPFSLIFFSSLDKTLLLATLFFESIDFLFEFLIGDFLIFSLITLFESFANLPELFLI